MISFIRYLIAGWFLVQAGMNHQLSGDPQIVYQSDQLVITRLTDHTYLHTSYLQTDSWGKVECNGMIVANDQEAMVLDTPVDDKSSNELIEWIGLTLHCKLVGVVPTHFHEDCLGGLNAFHELDIPSYANVKTIELAQSKGYALPENGFTDSLSLKVGTTRVYLNFPGEGHTRDNIVAYFPVDDVLFGGCLIKTLKAGKGNLEDANLETWSESVEKVASTYPNVRIVIPGHGKTGGKELLEYTETLFKKNN